MKTAPLLLLGALGISTACGGNAPPTVAPSSTAASAAATEGSPAERCLAIAGAKRERHEGEPAQVSIKHVLVQYAGAKRAPAATTRTREEACLRAQEARRKLETGSSFGEIVASYSEEPGAATREGSIGPVSRAMVVPPFADAAFELGVGQVSHVVETDFGFHVLMRTE